MSNSFFEKLKKGMDLEKTTEEQEEKDINEIPIELEEKSSLNTSSSKDEEDREKKKKIHHLQASESGKKENIDTKKTVKKPLLAKSKSKKEWPKSEGQLAVDVYQTESDLVIQSAIAGVKSNELDISVEGDLVTIKGERKRPIEEGEDYFSQECYWGPFSRKIILPVEVDPGRIDASLNNGILTIRMPKILREKKTKVTIKTL